CARQRSSYAMDYW
nr:immunoglobulin heavy chain junction region [Mus musculus]